MKREAILIAGMHRSGTSALTRVLSLLGAELPKNLLPAMKGVNEHGFWESADLVELHEALLTSAGSDWQDWAEFNQDWYRSAVGHDYQQKISQFISQDFASSGLFAIKDPRICRFLPLWLGVLSDLDVKPVVVIPVRHPMEVAHSLHKRDGFSIPKSLLIWSRYVLDSVFYAKNSSPIFVSYDDLLLDWKRVVHKISSQGSIFFPARSAEREFSIDQFLDVRAKNNNFPQKQLNSDVLEAEGYEGIYELSDVIFSNLKILVESDSIDPEDESLAKLLDIRRNFNKFTALFAVPFHEERAVGRAHLLKAEQLREACAKELENEVACFSKKQQDFDAERQHFAKEFERFKADRMNFEVENLGFVQEHKLLEEKLQGLEQEREGFEQGHKLLEEKLQVLEQEREGFEQEREGFEQEREGFEQGHKLLKEKLQVLDQEREGFEQEREGFEQGLKSLVGERDKLLAANAILADINGQQDAEQEMLIKKLASLQDTACDIYRQQEVKNESDFMSFQQVLVRNHRVASLTSAFGCAKLTKKQMNVYRQLFDFSFYKEKYVLDVKDIEAAIAHYCEQGVWKDCDPHPLFSTHWYLQQNPDVAEAGINPFFHFIKVGSVERRSPHPLFDSGWYLDSYPDVAQSGENPLSHYMRNGCKEGRNPNPLFDALWYQQLYPEVIGQNLLLHYLNQGYKDKPATHPLFLVDFLHEKHQVMRESDMPALEFYYRFGEDWGWDPHPLFDSAFYREKYSLPDEMSAVKHFLVDGEKHLLDPSAFFNTQWYLENYSAVSDYGRHPLLHYLLEGSAQGFRPNPVFDPTWYREQYPESVRGIEALTGYVSTGYLSGHNPGPYFDNNWYINQDSALVISSGNPLHHYLTVGRLEGRSTSPKVTERKILPHYPQVPMVVQQEVIFAPEQKWSDLEVRTDGVVDVIIPVYKGFGETLNCIYSVLAAAVETSYCLVVINDASPDTELSQALEVCASEGLFIYVKQQKNAGFVATVNRGMSMHLERDVVLLNSDTEVYDGWLDRILAVAVEHDDAATVTPLSNNATICSYPFFPERDFEPLEIDYAVLDRFTADVNRGVVVEAPTGVGFCMYLRRTCLDAVGLFDYEAFGRGYGEENDFCQRAERAGWTNLITADTFVRHWGGASFQEEKQTLINNAIQVLNVRHPEYLTGVREFIANDPLSKARENLDWVRLEAEKRTRNILIICHSRGGGTEKHVREDVAVFSECGYGVFFMRPDPRYPSHVVLSGENARLLPNLPLIEFSDEAAVVAVLNRLGITDIHTHGLVDFLPDAPRALAAAVTLYRTTVGAFSWEVNIHDYKVVCPRITLSDEQGVYCGEPGDYGCNRCLQKRGSEFPVSNIADWREIHAEALAVADKVIVPDEDVKCRLERYYPELECEVSPHETLTDIAPQTFPLVLKNPARLRVVVIGGISRHKGFDVLSAAARFAKAHQLTIEFVLLGYSVDNASLAECGVDVLGEYSDDTVLEHLVDLNADVVWLPSLWPETYSYTLSLALRAKLPVAAFEIGAIARRLQALEQGELLMPLNWYASPASICEFFMKHVRWIR